MLFFLNFKAHMSQAVMLIYIYLARLINPNINYVHIWAKLIYLVIACCVYILSILIIILLYLFAIAVTSDTFSRQELCTGQNKLSVWVEMLLYSMMYLFIPII